MRIFIDGQKIPANVRASKDLLLVLRTIAKTLHWKLWHDPSNEVVYISSAPNDTAAADAQAVLQTLQRPESSRLEGKVICLDAGHGGSDAGEHGTNGTMEKEHTLKIACLLRELLENNGATVVMTREADQNAAYPNASLQEELAARVDIVSESGADLCVSIHSDWFAGMTAAGTTTFHYGDQESMLLAECIQHCLVDELGTLNRGSRFASLPLIRYVKIPAVVTHIAFISNPEEELLLASTDGRTKAAQSIFNGIARYFKV